MSDNIDKKHSIVPDTSVIIDGRITEKLKSGEYRGASIIIPEALISELEAQANRGKETGFKGLEELKDLNEMAKKGEIRLEFAGKRPTYEQVKMASGGEIDAIIRNVAVEHKAFFITSDRVQAEVARAKGLDVEYIHPLMEELKILSIEDFFTEDTTSVHLKHNVPPMAKRGFIGNLKFVKIRDEVSTEEELHNIIRELIERAKRDPNSSLEIEYNGAMVFQIGSMRIAVALPPFSDGMEITAVRPIAVVELDSYKFSKELKDKIVEHQRGILIAGQPGAGKSTYAAGIAKYLLSKDFVVKTMESPRDLQVPESITQYSALEGKMEKTADVILLVRPDYVIYDEVRKTSDFHVFSDMRLAGVGMIGVVHANRAVDAIQRLIGRVELGIIPQIVDTVIFIEKGEVSKVYNIKFTVKVPSGMQEQDLARPVIIVTDFETQNVEYEIYTYGEQVMVMPVGEGEFEVSGVWKLASIYLKKEFQKLTGNYVDVEIVSDSSATVYMDSMDIPAIIGRGGSTIEEIQRRFGIHLNIREKNKVKKKEKHDKNIDSSSFIPVVERGKKYVTIRVEELAGETVDVYCDENYIFTATFNRKGDIKVSKDTDVAYKILEKPLSIILKKNIEN